MIVLDANVLIAYLDNTHVHHRRAVEVLVSDDDPDTALCGVDQSGVGWNLGWPVCQACLAVAEGRMS